MDPIPVFPRINASWSPDGALEVVFPNREDRLDRRMVRSLTAGVLMALGGVAAAFSLPAGAVVWACGWLTSLVLHAQAEPDRRRTAAIVALDLALLTVALAAAPGFAAWALGLIGAAEIAVRAETLLPHEPRQSRIRLWAERVAWGHGSAAAAAVDIPLANSLPVEALQPELVRTEDGVALQLAPGVLLPVAEEVAPNLGWLRDRIATLVEARRVQAAPVDQLALRQLGQLARTEARPTRSGWARWLGPMGVLAMVFPLLAVPGSTAVILLSVAYVWVASAGRSWVTRDPWSPRTALAPLLLPGTTPEPQRGPVARDHPTAGARSLR